MRVFPAFIAASVLCVGALALGAPKVPPKPWKPPAKVVPKPSASVSVSASTPPAPVESAAAVVPSTGPVGPLASAVSPLTPRADEAPPTAMPSSSAKWHAAHDELMAEIVALRARVTALANSVFKSKVAVRIRTGGSHAKIHAVKLLLDGAQVWTGGKGFVAEDEVAIFEGGVAAGLHTLSLEIERRDGRSELFRTIDRTTATLSVPDGKRLEVEARVEDDSTMGGDFPSDEVGRYDLRLRLRVKAVK